MQIEAQAAARKGKGKANNQGDDDDEESSEYEQIDDLPKRDDADKTKPPPSRRRRKKSAIDENGELSPAILLQQIKKIRGNLSAVKLVEEEDKDYSGEASNSHAVEARTKDLLRKLSNIKAQGFTASGAPQADKQESAKGSDSIPTFQTSIFDSRLEILEKFIGTNEADVDEVSWCNLFFFILTRSEPDTTC
jgi:hypothetical protein